MNKLKTAPILTIFIGGNHEASGYLQELPNGGWVAPNIYYMGHANCINFAGIRIAGLSGIFNKHHYHMGHWERPPFDEYGSAVSVYHVRAVDVFRLKQLQPRNDDKSGPIDVMLSHDWPAGITDYGNVDDLLRRKPFFKEDIQKNTLGNPATMCLVHELRPRYWLAAHLHCKFAALIAHSDSTESESNKENVTRFLSLDKPLPRRHFIQILEFDVDEDADLNLSYDPTWLAILKATDSFTDASKRVSYSRSLLFLIVDSSRICVVLHYMPSRGHSSVDEMSSDAERCDYRPTKEELDHIDRLFNGHFTIPLNFRQTAPPHSATEPFKHTEFYYRNPQSMEFCSKLGIRDLNEILCAQSANGVGTAFYLMPNDDSKQQDNTSAIQSSCTDSEVRICCNYICRVFSLFVITDNWIADNILIVRLFKEFEDGLDFKIDRGRRSSPIRIDSDQLKSE
ncbi:unnamed protein product [Anisakis simplex]|uniref:Lariat debranching enzyme (inferred by orthology to a C. elegans protein) n=1 Tax=Anisakis simplex TaxID=6269 RepID=A0A0M3KFP4_ANISI|nr:unnamed protein product [Anisakis simplex]